MTTSNSKPEPTTHKVGTVLEFTAKSEVTVTRPNGADNRLHVDAGGHAAYVLDVPGTFTVTVDGKSHDVESA